MDIFQHAQREIHNLQQQIDSSNKKLAALQRVIREYTNDAHPTAARIHELILECLKEHAGEADFEQIADYLLAHYAFLPRQRISLALTKFSPVSFNRKTQKWEMVSQEGA